MNNQRKISPKNVFTYAFKRGVFDFITKKQGENAVTIEHEKQRQALEYLTNNSTEEFAYGGAAGGAKSWTGCVWLLFMCSAYAETKWFIGREELTRLKASTLVTFRKVAKAYGFKENVDYKYQGQEHYLQFANGSRIDLLDLKYQPRDPLYERYGSVEYTGGWIEEGGEVDFGAYDTLRSRIGRQNNDKYNILGKLFVTLNPKKNWCHSTFWKPFKNGTLLENTKFLQALATDNTFIDSGYIDKLQSIKDKQRRERLLLGNFDYDDDEDALMDYDSLNDLFTNNVEGGDRYLTADVARFGKDATVIYEWEGNLVVKRHYLLNKSITYTSDYIKAIAARKNIPRSHILIDEDGVGGGVVDAISGCKGFVNGSAALPNPNSKEKENYQDLATQCGYMAAAMVMNRKIGFSPHFNEDKSFKDKFIEEAEQVKRRDGDSDGKLKLVKKEHVKTVIKRSPDDWDAFKMFMYFSLKPRKKFNDANY